VHKVGNKIEYNNMHGERIKNAYMLSILVYLCRESCSLPIPVAARSKEGVCGRTLAGIVGPNPAGGMDVFFFSECSVLSG
jgi:hypothetical protein